MAEFISNSAILSPIRTGAVVDEATGSGPSVPQMAEFDIKSDIRWQM